MQTQANLYYELGIAQALGKETIVIKTPEVTMPSDLARTEYIEFDIEFDKKFTDFLENIIERAEYFEEIAKNTENNPLQIFLVLKYSAPYFCIFSFQ
jgi:predicted nucleotide-binding protein